MKLRLSDFDSNTYEDTDGSCDLCMYTGMLDHPMYTFTDSYDGVHTVEGWYSDWGHLTIIDINLPVFTRWLHGVEFKEPEELADYVGVDAGSSDFYDIFLRYLITAAQWCSTEEELNESLKDLIYR